MSANPSNVARRSRLLSVSAYDRVAGLLISLLLLLGLFVAVLGFIWIGSRFVRDKNRTVPVVWENETTGGVEYGVGSEGMTVDAPTLDEIRRDTNVVLPDFRQTLATVDDLVASRRTELENSLGLLEVAGGAAGKSSGTGNAPAFGSGEGTGGIARSDRWEIRFTSGETLEEYCRELDFFAIEPAAVDATGRLEYCRKLSQPNPEVVRNRTEPETRLFMSWRPGSARRETDRRLLERCGIDTAEKTIVQFIPAEVEQRLARLEREFNGREPAAIRKTVFAVRRANDGYEFFVESQIPRS